MKGNVMNKAIIDAFEAILPPEQRALRLKGRELDGYVIKDMLDEGVGGFGVVYLAEHPQIGKVAIKVLAVDVEADPKAYERYQREVTLLCDMGDAHNIVKIRHAGVVEHLPWYAMELVEGKTLEQWLKSLKQTNKKVTYTQLSNIIQGVLIGISEAQSACRKVRKKIKGEQLPDCIVHRDIKPSNIMVIEQDEGTLDIKLIDLGIAGLFKSGSKTDISFMTQGTLSAKTPDYASPEMSLRPEALDVRSDIFQVGLLAFEIMTGERYWTAWPESEAMLMRAKGWPRWLKKAILRSLNWYREERYKSAGEFSKKIKHPYWNSLRPKELWRMKWRTLATMSCLSVLVLSVLLWTTDGQLKQSLVEIDILRETANPLSSIKKHVVELSEGKFNIKQTKELIDECNEFKKNSPNDSSLKTDGSLSQLMEWFKIFLDGKLEITPIKFENYGYSDMKMLYKILYGDQPKLEYVANEVKGTFLGGGEYKLDFAQNQKVTLGPVSEHNPNSAKVVFEVDDQKFEKDVSLVCKEVIMSKNDEIYMYLPENGKYKLLVKIKREGFGALQPMK